MWFAESRPLPLPPAAASCHCLLPLPPATARSLCVRRVAVEPGHRRAAAARAGAGRAGGPHRQGEGRAGRSRGAPAAAAAAATAGAGAVAPEQHGRRRAEQRAAAGAGAAGGAGVAGGAARAPAAAVRVVRQPRARGATHHGPGAWWGRLDGDGRGVGRRAQAQGMGHGPEYAGRAALGWLGCCFSAPPNTFAPHTRWWRSCGCWMRPFAASDPSREQSPPPGTPP